MQPHHRQMPNQREADGLWGLQIGETHAVMLAAEKTVSINPVPCLLGEVR